MTRTTFALALQVLDEPGRFRGEFRSVRRAQAQHKLDIVRQAGRSLQEVGNALLAGVPPHEDHTGLGGIDAEGANGVFAFVRLPHVDVDAVVDHPDLGGIHVRIAAQDVLPHAVRDGDDGRGGLIGGLFNP